VLSGGGSVPSTNATPEAWVGMVNEMQRGALSTRLGIPMLYGIDAVHGHGNVYRATIFPHNVGLGCTRYLARYLAWMSPHFSVHDEIDALVQILTDRPTYRLQVVLSARW
jgi:hypothetical protein